MKSKASITGVHRPKSSYDLRIGAWEDDVVLQERDDLLNDSGQPGVRFLYWWCVAIRPAGWDSCCVRALGAGVYIFRMVAGAIDLATLGSELPQGLLGQVAADGMSGFLILLAMVLGLVLPKMSIEACVLGAIFK